MKPTQPGTHYSSKLSPARKITAWGVAGIFLVVVMLGLVVRYWHPVYGFTAFLQLGQDGEVAKISAFREHPVFVYRDTGGYDGQYYAQIAYDPTLRSRELQGAIDNLPYRARRILMPALAWTLSAGQPAWTVHVYAMLNLFCWGVLAWLAWLLLNVKDARSFLSWSGLLFSAGVLHSIRLALPDLPALTLIAGSMLALERRPGIAAPGLLAAATLTRETSALAFPSLLRSPWVREGNWRKNLLQGMLVSLPLGAWLLYVQIRLEPGSDPGWQAFAFPFQDYIKKWNEIISSLQKEPDRLLAWSTTLAMLSVTVHAAWFILRPQPSNSWWKLGVPYILLLSLLGTAVWEGHPGAYTRVMLPLHLAFSVLIVRMRAPFVLIIMGNLTALSGFAAMRHPYAGTAELAAARTNHVSVVARSSAGWYPTEATMFQRRTWSRGDAKIELQTWPADQVVHATMRFEIRAFTPRNLEIRQGRRVLWQGMLNAERRHIILEGVILTRELNHLDFVSDAPPAPESASPMARPLAFAIYNLSLNELRIDDTSASQNK